MKNLWLLAANLAIIISLGFFGQIVQMTSCTHVSKNLEIIVLWDCDFVNASEKCFNLVSNSWNIERGNILYLSANVSVTPRADMSANRVNFEWALNSWLQGHSDHDTQIWLWIFGHGIGLHHQPPQYLLEEDWWLAQTSGEVEARAEINSDEGPEITEYLIGKDVNGDGQKSNNTWVGVDEGLVLYPLGGEELIWDDEFKGWLENVNYGRSTILLFACQNPETYGNNTGSCYSGGFIDDLSAPRRIIISCTNETYEGWADEHTGISYFADAFMNALNPESPEWYQTINLVDNDDYPSVLEAFRYAYEHDMARRSVRTENGTVPDPWQPLFPRTYRLFDESPWLDDGGNFLPTFVNLTDVGANSTQPYDSSDSWLARYTWPFVSRYSGCVEDVNDDGSVDVTDLYIVGQCYGDTYPTRWRSKASLADVNQDNEVDVADYYAVAQKYGWTQP